MSDLTEKFSGLLTGTVKDVKGTMGFVASDLQRSQVVMVMYMQEHFRRETVHANRLLQLYETVATAESHPRFEKKIAQTIREDLNYWREQLLVAEQIDTLLDKVYQGASKYSSFATQDRSALEAACDQLEKSLQQ